MRDLKTANDELMTIQREVEVLRAQNIALRIAVDSSNVPTTDSTTNKAGTRHKREEQDRKEASSAAFGTGRGHVLGAAPSGGWTDLEKPEATGAEEYRQQMHSKWENEKKLQKRYVLVYYSITYPLPSDSNFRISVMEKRLQEKIDENEDLQNQLRKARDTVQTAVTTKDELQKRVTATTKLTQVRALLDY